MERSIKVRESFLSFIAKAFIATIVSTVSATWTVRTWVAETDKRVSAVEQDQKYGREVTQVKQDSLSKELSEMHTDVREIRDVVFKGSH